MDSSERKNNKAVPSGVGEISGPTPLPRRPMIAIGVMIISISLSETVLFPFAAFMVASFNVTDDPTKLGYYAGFLASAFYAGCLVSSSFWGIISDKVGRKPVLVLGVLANAVCAFSFGFSVNFPMALTTRFLNGLLNGVLPIGRTVVSELSDQSNQAQGFSLIGACWGIGFLIGPAIGGFLSEPSKKYPSLFPKNSIFDRFAYSPPCILLTAVAIVGLIFVILWLPETRGRARAAPTKIEIVKEEARDESSSILNGEGSLNAPLLTESITQSVDANGQVHEMRQNKFGIGGFDAFYNKDTFVSSMIYSLMGMLTAAQNEVFPLWGMSSSKIGGLEFGTDYIGLSQASAGLALIPFNLFLYSKIANHLGPLKTLKVMLAGMATLTFFPVVLFFEDPTTRLLFCIAFMMVRGVTVISAFTSVMICITNSIVDPQYLGSINGLLQTLNMSLEAIGPTFGASMYAWSVGGTHWFPFDFHLFWIVWGLFCAGMFFLACLLSDKVHERKFITENPGDED